MTASRSGPRFKVGDKVIRGGCTKPEDITGVEETTDHTGQPSYGYHVGEITQDGSMSYCMLFSEKSLRPAS